MRRDNRSLTFRILVGIVIFLLAVLLGLLLFLFLYVKTDRRVDLTKYITVEFIGKEGEGRAYATYDPFAFENDFKDSMVFTPENLEERIREDMVQNGYSAYEAFFVYCVGVDLTPQEDLKNGDIVTMKFNINSHIAKSVFGLGIFGSTKDFTASGLREEDDEQGTAFPATFDGNEVKDPDDIYDPGDIYVPDSGDPDAGTDDTYGGTDTYEPDTNSGKVFAVPKDGYSGKAVTVNFYVPVESGLPEVLDRCKDEFEMLYPRILISFDILGTHDQIAEEIIWETETGVEEAYTPGFIVTTPSYAAMLAEKTGKTVGLDELIESRIPLLRADGTDDVIGLSDEEIETVEMFMPFGGFGEFTEYIPVPYDNGETCLCLFGSDDPDEVIARWLFMKYIFTNAGVFNEVLW